MRFVPVVAATLGLVAAVHAVQFQLSPRSDAVDATVFLIRHGEKIDDDHTGLSERGEERADCITGLFSQGAMKVDAIITQDYKSNGKRIRPYDTVMGLAAKLGVTVDHHCDRDDTECAANTIAKAAKDGAKQVLVCWEHDALSDIAAAIGVQGITYPDDRFDLVYEIRNGQLHATLSEDCPSLD